MMRCCCSFLVFYLKFYVLSLSSFFWFFLYHSYSSSIIIWRHIDAIWWHLWNQSDGLFFDADLDATLLFSATEVWSSHAISLIDILRRTTVLQQPARRWVDLLCLLVDHRQTQEKEQRYKHPERILLLLVQQSVCCHHTSSRHQHSSAVPQLQERMQEMGLCSRSFTKQVINIINTFFRCAPSRLHIKRSMRRDYLPSLQGSKWVIASKTYI